jgi:hypothetical protein
MAVQTVGIDLSITGIHSVEAVDEGSDRCGQLSFRIAPQGLAALAEICFRDRSAPIVLLELMGLVWLPIAMFLRAHCPQTVLVLAKEQTPVAPMVTGRVELDVAATLKPVL